MTTEPRHHASCDVAIIRQHTPVETWVDGSARMLCLQIIGDHSVVVLGLTGAGADMLMSQMKAGLNDLHAAQHNLTMTTAPLAVADGAV